MTYKCLKIGDRRRTALIADWEKWLRKADALYARFYERVGDSPFNYHEVSSVGFLASASAIAGFLPMNEYDVAKKGRFDKRTRVPGRADLWMDAGSYCYSFEFKRTRRPVTPGYLIKRLAYAVEDVACVPNDECNFAAGCLIALADDDKRERVCVDFAGHENVDFAYRIGPKGKRAFLYFKLKG